MSWSVLCVGLFQNQFPYSRRFASLSCTKDATPPINSHEPSSYLHTASYVILSSAARALIALSAATARPVLVATASGVSTLRATVSVSGMVDLACFANDFDLVIIAMITVDEEGEKLRLVDTISKRLSSCGRMRRIGTHKSDRKSYNVNDRKRPARFEHRADFAEVVRPATVALLPILPKDTKIAVDAGGCAKIRAACAADATQNDDGSNQRGDESEIHGCDEEGVVAGAQVADEREEDPDECQHRHDEEQQNKGWCELVGLHVAVHEPGQHADNGNQRDHLEQPP